MSGERQQAQQYVPDMLPSFFFPFLSIFRQMGKKKAQAAAESDILR